MPYPTLESLPDSVKVLPKDAQEIWRNTANSSLEKTPGDDEKASKIAWGAVKNAGWAKDAEGNWKKSQTAPKTHEFDVEVFSVGIWNGDAYTEGDLNEMVHAFYELQEKVKPPVKLAHDNSMHLKDGQPSLGWVKGLKKVGDKLIATVTQVPEVLYKAITSGRYKRVSAEIYWNLKESGKVFKRVLSAVGLLGADIPAVTNLADLEAFLSMTPEAGTFEKMATYAFDVNESGEIKIDEEDNKMSDEKIKQLTDELNKAKADLEKSQDENKTYKAEAEALKKEKSESLKTARVDEVKTFCEQMVKDGKMTPAARDILVNDLDKHSYTDDNGFAIPFEAFKKVFETHAKVFDVGEKGQEGGGEEKKEYANAGEELEAKTRKYMADHKDVNYAEASRAVLESDKDLAERYALEDL